MTSVRSPDSSSSGVGGSGRFGAPPKEQTDKENDWRIRFGKRCWDNWDKRLGFIKETHSKANFLPFGLSSWWEFWALCEDDDDESDDGLKGENSGLQRRTNMRDDDGARWRDEAQVTRRRCWRSKAIRRDEARRGGAMWCDAMRPRRPCDAKCRSVG